MYLAAACPFAIPKRSSEPSSTSTGYQAHHLASLGMDPRGRLALLPACRKARERFFVMT